MNKGRCIWLTGLPCSGKTTIALGLLKHMDAVHLDGDTMRSNDLYNNKDFSVEGRRRHILTMGMIAKTLVEQGQNVICSFISPERAVRKQLKKSMGKSFIQFYINADLKTCKDRDVKGMYAKAMNGEIKNFTGVDADYDEPTVEECFSVDTVNYNVDSCVKTILHKINGPKKTYSMFVGRWNGTFHAGHDHIIQTKLKEGKNVLLAVRDVEPDDKNPWTSREVKQMLEYRFKHDERVRVIIIPDIRSIEYGRGVGYEVNEIKVDSNIAGISGTKIREMMRDNNSEWMDLVPKEIAEFISAR